MWAIATDLSVICLVGSYMLVMTVTPAEMAECIEKSFVGQTHVGQRNHLLYVGTYIITYIIAS